MRLIDAEITDVLGARKQPVRFGSRLTIIAGANGSGKSTIRRALLATLEGGEDLERLQNVDAGDDAEPAVVVRAEEDGRSFQFERVPKRVTAKRAVLDKRGKPTAALEPVPQAASWMRALLPVAAVDVVGLLQARGERLVTMILQACPLKMNRADLLAHMGLAPAEIQPPVPAGLHPLVECAEIHDRVFSARQAINRDEKSARQTAEQLLRTIPKDIPDDLAPAIAMVEDQVRDLTAAVAIAETRAHAEADAALKEARTEAEAESERVRSAHKQAVRDRKATHEQWAADQRAEVERRIAAAAAKLETGLDELRADTQRHLDEIDAQLEASSTEISARRLAALKLVDDKRGVLAESSTRLSVLREQDKRAALDRNTRRQADEKTAEATKLAAESQRLTKALAALEEFRRTLAEDLPLPGLSIADKEIKVDGVPWEQLNEAKRVALLVKLVVLGAREASLPLVVVDEAEKLVGANWVALLRELAAAPVQALVMRAEDHPLSVVPIDGQETLDAYLQGIEAAVAS